MRIRTGLGLLGLLTILACGGAGGGPGLESEIIVDIDPLNGATSNQLFLAISPSDGSYDAPRAISTTQDQTWATRTLAASYQRYRFKTRLVDAPYQVWVGTTGSIDRNCRITITVDGVEQFNRDGTALAGTPQEVVRIYQFYVEGFSTGKPQRGAARK